MNEVAQALRDGLERLRERGLTKDRLCDSATGSVCARGALMNSVPRNYHWENWRRWEVQEADLLFGRVAKEQYPGRVRARACPTVDFNNHPDTTQEDVERVFEKAILRAEEMVV